MTTLSDPIAAQRFTLRSATGVVAVVGELGAQLVELQVPDRDGVPADVTLGFDTDAEYRRHAGMHIGASIGRVAGRIKDARFELDGETFALAANEPPNHLHGGPTRSFARVLWSGERIEVDGGPGARFTYVSPDGEEGYPGTMTATASYALIGNDLRLTYEATTDRRTPLSLTSHAYWNLAGAGSATILDHVLRIPASTYTLTDDGLVPTGDVALVQGTALDFLAPRRIGDRIAALEDEPSAGYDHNYLVDEPAGTIRTVAWLREPSSGRTLEILSTEEAIQFYAGNRMASVPGKGGTRYSHRSGLCLEPQVTPDAVHRHTGRSSILEPGERYRHEIVFRFGVT